MKKTIILIAIFSVVILASMSFLGFRYLQDQNKPKETTTETPTPTNSSNNKTDPVSTPPILVNDSSIYITTSSDDTTKLIKYNPSTKKFKKIDSVKVDNVYDSDDRQERVGYAVSENNQFLYKIASFTKYKTDDNLDSIYTSGSNTISKYDKEKGTFRVVYSDKIAKPLRYHYLSNTGELYVFQGELIPTQIGTLGNGEIMVLNNGKLKKIMENDFGWKMNTTLGNKEIAYADNDILIAQFGLTYQNIAPNRLYVLDKVNKTTRIIEIDKIIPGQYRVVSYNPSTSTVYLQSSSHGIELLAYSLINNTSEKLISYNDGINIIFSASHFNLNNYIASKGTANKNNDYPIYHYNFVNKTSREITFKGTKDNVCDKIKVINNKVLGICYVDEKHKLFSENSSAASAITILSIKEEDFSDVSIDFVSHTDLFGN